MANQPTVNDWNPTGARFIAKVIDDMYQYYHVYRWDPPEGYFPVAVCRGMMGVDARTQAEELAAWYNERYPLSPDTAAPSS